MRNQSGGINIDITINGDVYVNGAEEFTKKTKSVHKIRTSQTVKSAKATVKSRDACCQACGEMDKILEVHHILPVSKYPELAADETNMITLCQSCHRKYHDKYGGSEGAESFAKFMRDYGNRW